MENARILEYNNLRIYLYGLTINSYTRDIEKISTIRIHEDMHSGKPLRYLYTIKSWDHNPELWKYSNFAYDERGQLKRFYSLCRVINSSNVVTETMSVKMELKNGEVINYQDNEGNVWKKEWGVPLVFRYKDFSANHLKYIGEYTDNLKKHAITF